MGKLGRPRKQQEERFVSGSFTLTPAQVRWLEERASIIGENASASAVVRGCLRYARAKLKSGELSSEEFEGMAK